MTVERDTLEKIAARGCQTMYIRRPKEWTCLDDRRWTIGTRDKDNLTPNEWGQKTIDGEHLCDPCRARGALEATEHEHEWDEERPEDVTYTPPPAFDKPWIIRICLDLQCGAIKVTRLERGKLVEIIYAKTSEKPAATTHDHIWTHEPDIDTNPPIQMRRCLICGRLEKRAGVGYMGTRRIEPTPWILVPATRTQEPA